MKKIIYLFIGLCSVLGLQTQNLDSSAMRKLQLAEFAISDLYVGVVDESKLVESATIEMLAQLDPHSVYSDAEEVKKVNEPLQGNLEGIGVQFQMIEDALLIVQPVNNGLSEKAGIPTGDHIITVSDTAIAGVKIGTEKIMGRLRDPKDSKVNLAIIRRGVEEPLLFNVKRDKIPILSLDAAYMIQPKTGYIRINRFGATTAGEFLKTLRELQKKGVKDLILDLQSDGGGYLNAAINLADEFLGQKELVVYIEERSAQHSGFSARGNGSFRSRHLVVLIDEYSASTSGVVTGAIQGWDRGVTVERRSFGKELVQRPVDLPDGSMIRLTIVRYYIPAGRYVQKPYDGNINEKSGEGKNSESSIDKYNQDLIDRYSHGEIVSADSIHFPNSLKCQTKKLGYTAYGGGGTMPDYFAPVDTTLYTDYHRSLVTKGVVIKTTVNFTENNRKALLDKYKTFEKFNKKFEIDDQILDFLRETADEEKIEFNEEQYNRTSPLIKTQLKTLIARDLWDMNEYLQVMNTIDKSVERALEILNDKEYEKVLK